MLEQVSTAVTFVAFYAEDGVGKTGLTVTVDVRRVSDGTELVTAGSATEIGDGFYKYTLASGSTATESEYVAVFKTADTDVDQQHIPALWAVGRAGVENLDATVSSRGTGTALTAAGVRSAIGMASADLDTQLDALAVDEAAIAAAVVAELESNEIEVTVAGPAITDGANLSIVQGVDYTDANAIEITVTGAGVGAMDGDDWSLWFNTPGADAQTIAATTAVAEDASTLVLTFEPTAAVTGELIATHGLWGLHRTPTGSEDVYNPKRGKLIVLPDLTVRRSP